VDAGASGCFLHDLYGQTGRIPTVIRADIGKELSVAGAECGSRLSPGERETANDQRKGGADGGRDIILRTAQTTLDSSKGLIGSAERIQ
jgi:hypothetical protein